MALQCGIVGLPNVGKSTLFNCLSNAKAQAANFPFCTIEPNVGVITVITSYSIHYTKLYEYVHQRGFCKRTTYSQILERAQYRFHCFSWIST